LKPGFDSRLGHLKLKSKEIFLTIIGIFFILLSIIGIIMNIKAKTSYNLVSFCNHTSIILGLAFIFRSSFWITAELNIGLFPQLLWSIDFLSKLIFNRFIFGFTNYMFFPDYPKALYILSWNHVFIVPIALLGLYFLNTPKKDAWKGSLLHGILLIPLSHIFDNRNLNCMLESCVPFIPTNALYKIIWPFIMLIIVIIPTNFLLHWVYKKRKNLMR